MRRRCGGGGGEWGRLVAVARGGDRSTPPSSPLPPPPRHCRVALRPPPTAIDRFDAASDAVVAPRALPRATIGAPNRITAFSAPLRRPRPRATTRRQAEAEARALSELERRQKALDDAKLTTMEKLTDEEQDRILESALLDTKGSE